MISASETSSLDDLSQDSIMMCSVGRNSDPVWDDDRGGPNSRPPHWRGSSSAGKIQTIIFYVLNLFSLWYNQYDILYVIYKV